MIKLQALVILLLTAWGSAFSQTKVDEKAMKTRLAGDSLMLDYKLKDLSEIKQYYQRETNSLLAEKDRLRNMGIVEMESLLESYPDSPILDKIIIRLAELYYEQEVRDFEYRMEEYLSQVDETGQVNDSTVQEPKVSFPLSLDMYQRIVDDFPESALVDDALYNIGFLLEEMGEREESAVIFRSVVHDYPQSTFVADALMHIAEYYFNPPVTDLASAIPYYKRVLEYKETPLYDAALYRLGWAYYRLSDYPEAISYFTVLADDIENATPVDPTQKYHFPAVRDEAVEYIGISFLDYGGAQNAASYFETLGGRQYGYDVFKKIGDSYMDVKEEYASAIQSYEFLLAMYPYTPDAPDIQFRITQAYRRLENTQMAYQSRRELFKKFGPTSDWWSHVSSLDRERAKQLTEKAMRENIDYLLATAEEHQDAAIYRQAVGDSREYLKAFPVDTNAARIHWNMALVLDTKLDESETAFQEYVAISNLYLNSPYRKQAAENAIALADERARPDSSAVAQAQKAPETDGATLAFATKLQPEPLTADEKRVIFSLDNYIKNFPHEPETEKILAKAGGVYYEKRQFRETIKYFKTLARHFPKSEEINYARFITMESYFGKGDYRSTELMAKRIRSNSPIYGNRAQDRLSEAIFLQAKTASDSSEHLVAANEYLRMVEETPDSKIADRALYNAGVEFDKAKEYYPAIQAYSQLVERFPQSEHYLPATNNLAFDYREVSDFRNAGVVYERLAQIDTNATQARTALYNASISYVQAEAWQSAIAVNNRFSEKYPDADEAADLLFDNAGHYLKLDSLDAANQIYARFTEKYPDSPRVIEAYLRRGEYYKSTGNSELAKAQFESAIARFEEFQGRNLDPDEFLVAEALFQLAGLKYVDYAAIKFSLPASQMALNKENKKKLLRELVDNYTQVAGYGTLRLYEATYKVGSVYEEFAKTWAAQEIEESDAAKRIVARNEINQAGGELYEKAVTAFKDGAIALKAFSEKNLQPEETLAPVDSTQETAEVIKIDSTLQVAQNWIRKCEDKVSQNLFTIAELKEHSLEQFVNAPTPADMTPVEALVYHSQVLQQGVMPLAEEVVQIHLRNLSESQELGTQNVWVDSARQAVVRVSSIVPTSMRELSGQALQQYSQIEADYENGLTNGDLQTPDRAEQLVALAELVKQRTIEAAKSTNAHLEQILAVAVDSAYIAEQEQAFMTFAYSQAVRADSLAEQADSKRAHFQTLFDQTDKFEYEDATYIFDDIYFALSDGADELLKYAFGASQQLENDSQGKWRQKIALALIKTRPEEYASRFGLEFTEWSVPSAGDWQVSASKASGWQNVETVAEAWAAADSLGASDHLSNNEARTIWLAGQRVVTGSDTSETNGESALATSTGDSLNQAIVQVDTVYFRKSFDLDGLPVAASVELFAPSGYELFVNGQRVAVQSSESTVANLHDVTPFLQQGKNVVAIAAQPGETTAGLESVVRIKSLANWSALVEGNFDFSKDIDFDDAPETDRIAE